MSKRETVQIGDLEVTLAAPPSLSIRYEILGYDGQNPIRAGGAALGVCWQSKDRPKATYKESGQNPLTYGGLVLDDLLGRGLPFADIMAAADKAKLLLVADLVSASEVTEAEDFSEAPPAESTG